ncbi:MAG: hypothetical protein H6743_04280 [Rickettsiaceae bacterium]|nr:hypothetical protein [Rickettsiaceae bacterium]
MKILKSVMIIRITVLRIRFFLRHLSVTVWAGFYLMKPIRTKSENGAND